MRTIRTSKVVNDYPLGRPEDIPLDLAPDEAEKRGVMYAERPEWKDLPDWGDRADCPLLGLLPEILDEIFGLPSSLSLSDYVALAGTCKFFRKHLGDRFFEALLRDGNSRNGGYPIYGAAPRDIKARHPFSAPSFEQNSGPNMPLDRRTAQERSKRPGYFVPNSERSKWTQEEYLRHRAEKTEWALALAESNDEGRLRAEIARKEPYGRALNRYFRVPSLSHGSPAIRTGYTFLTEDVTEAVQRAQFDRRISERAADFAKVREAIDVRDDARKAYESYMRDRSATRTTDTSSDPHAEAQISVDLPKDSAEWTVPDTEEDCDLPFEDHDINTGERISADYAPSAWRRIAATICTRYESAITKREAIKKYKVSRAQLLTLKSFLLFCSQDPVYIDPRLQIYNHGGHCGSESTSSYDLQYYAEASVRGLALRAHGGPVGHAIHMSQAEADMPAQAIVRPVLKSDETPTAEDVPVEAESEDTAEHADPAETAAEAVIADAPPAEVAIEQGEMSSTPTGERSAQEALNASATTEQDKTVDAADQKDVAEDAGAQNMVDGDRMPESGEEKGEAESTIAPRKDELDHIKAATSHGAESRRPEEDDVTPEPPAKKSKTTHDA